MMKSKIIYIYIFIDQIFTFLNTLYKYQCAKSICIHIHNLHKLIYHY